MKGFTLIETILGITIVALVITAAAGLTKSSLSIGRLSMNKFIAYHLAEEGLEATRNARDSNWLQNRVWRYGFEDDGLYIVSGTLPPTLSYTQNPELGEKIALHKGNDFMRLIEIHALSREEIRVESTVTYTENGADRNVKLLMELTDWKKGPL